MSECTMTRAVPAAHSPAPLPQALEAGVWALLEPQERAAVRVSCREVRQQADQLLDTGVLRVPIAVEANKPPAAALAAFHRKLCLSQLRVQFRARHDNLLMQNYCIEYAAATGAGLSATSCSLACSRRGVCLPAVAALLHALPHLTHLRLAWNARSDQRMPQLLEVLGRCTQLQSLTLAWLHDTYSIIPDDDFAALCSLKQLHSLRVPWELTRLQLQTLCSALPKLTCLGVSGSEHLFFVETGGFPQIRSLSGLPAVDEAIDECSYWRPEHSTLEVDWIQTEGFPSLEVIKQCVLVVTRDAQITREQLIDVAGLIQRFAGSANAWALGVFAGKSSTLVLQQLSAGCWQGVQHMKVDFHDYDSSADAAMYPNNCNWQFAVISSVAAAAPNLSSLSLGLGAQPSSIHMALLPALRRLDQLHTLWLRVHGLHALDSTEVTALLMGLAMGLVQGRHRPGAVRRVMLQGGDERALRPCNQMLAAAGVLVRVGRW